MFSPAHELSNRKWVALASHRTWLLREAEKLFSFFERRIINPLGGFYDLDDGGDRQRPVTAQPTSPPPGISSQPRESFTLTP